MPPWRVKNSVAEPLPPTFIVRSWLSCQLSRLVDLSAEICVSSVHEIDGGRCAPDETDVHAHVTVCAGAIEADVHAECDAGPGRVASLAIEAHLHVPMSQSHMPLYAGRRTLLPLPALSTLKTCSVSAFVGSAILWWSW